MEFLSYGNDEYQVDNMSTKREQIKNVGIWIRVSTEDQASGDAPEHHEERARYYVKAKNWNVREVYHLEAVSGKAVLEHPEAQRMLSHISSGHITGLVFSKLARLARSTKELLEISDIFREYDADLISLQESIDTSTPAGRLFYTVIAAMAQWEREEIAERVKASIPVRARLGKRLGSIAPFGYKWEGNQLKLDEHEAPVRRLMFELFLEHRRKKTIVRILNERGYRTRRGGKWSDTSVDRLLRDPIAKGLRRANYTDSSGKGKQWILKPESEWVYSRVDPIVSEEMWNQVNAILDKQRASIKKIAKKTKHLFSGLVMCHCGHKMYVPNRRGNYTPKYYCYKCGNKIPTEDLEAVYQEQLKAFLLSPEELSAYLHQADDVISEKSEQLKVLLTEQRNLNKEMDKLYRLYIADKISADGFSRNHEPLEKRMKELERSIPELQSEVDYLKINYLSSSKVTSDAKNLYQQWSRMSREEKRALVELLTARIQIGENEIEIDLHFLPFSENDVQMATQLPRCERGALPAELTAHGR